MRTVSLILVLSLYTCSGHPAFARPFSCAYVPYWVKGYSRATVATTAADLGMSRAEVVRLLKCLPRS
jgi:hypothetical protein